MQIMLTPQEREAFKTINESVQTLKEALTKAVAIYESAVQCVIAAHGGAGKVRRVTLSDDYGKLSIESDPALLEVSNACYWI
jgi:hypothetical protein